MRYVTSIPRPESVSKVTAVYECAEWLTVTGTIKKKLDACVPLFIEF